jgi:hypothetical protein
MGLLFYIKEGNLFVCSFLWGLTSKPERANMKLAASPLYTKTTDGSTFALLQVGRFNWKRIAPLR